MLDPDWQFIVHACSPASDRRDTTAVRNWQRVVAIAVGQRVYPHVFRYAGDLLPADQRAVLEAKVKQNVHAALANVSRTVALVRLLAEAGIETIILKGPLLARTLYGDVAARVAGDIDLLVRESQFTTAALTLARAGYRHDTLLTEKALSRLRKSQHDLAFEHPDEKTLIELHADIAQPHYGYRVDLEAWWAARQQTTAGDAPVAVLRPEHAYLLSALHAAKHRWHRLDLVADLAAYGRLEGLDRRQICHDAERAWLLRPLEVGESIVASLFTGMAAPSGPARNAIGQMIAGQEFGRWAGIRFDLALRPRWQDKGLYLKRRLLSAKLGL